MENFNLEIDKKITQYTPSSGEKIFITTKIKKHKNWTKEEDNLLLEVALKFKEKCWTKVSEFFKDKNPAQCRARFKRIRPGIIKGPWTKEEDQKIIDLVEKSGRNWALISKMMPSRNGKQIRDRFINYLDPLINKLKFTPEEDAKITELYLEHGSRWSVIAKEFPGRTGDMIKNRFYSCLKRRIHVYEFHSTKKLRKNYYQTKRTKVNYDQTDYFNNPNPHIITNMTGTLITPPNEPDTNFNYLNFVLNQMKNSQNSLPIITEKEVVQLMQLCNRVNAK